MLVARRAVAQGSPIRNGPRADLASRRGRMGGLARGFALANAGHDTRSLQAYLGHRNIQHTVRYTSNT